MKKSKIISFIIVLLLGLSFPVSVNAASVSTHPDPQSIAENKINNFGMYSLVSSVVLYNINLQPEAICYNFSPAGYVIVNTNDYSIPEFSPPTNSPYIPFDSSNFTLIYNGPFNYYYSIDNNTLFSINTGATFTFDEINSNYHSEPNSSDYYILSYGETRSSSYTVTTDYTPATWSTPYYCVVDGCAIIFKYLDSYHNSTLLDTSFDENEELQEYLINNNYLPNSGVFSWQVPNGVLLSYTGVNGFFADRNVDFHSANYNYVESNLQMITQSLVYDYPLLMEIYTSTIWEYGQHYIIVYGYYTDGNESYFIVNDGFGNNGLWLDADPKYYGEMILFNQ